ncbi:MAG: hypothetical protein AAF481_14485 [Acidobacteriota bacterium]
MTDAEESKASWRLTYCAFELSPQEKTMNASFHLVYRVRVDSQGVPLAVEKVRSKFVDDDAVWQCVRGWRLPPVEEEAGYFLSSYWRHGHGWSSFQIQSEALSIEFDATGDLKPYSAPAPASEISASGHLELELPQAPE